MAGLRLEMLAPGYWLLLLLLPVVFYFSLKTYAESGHARRVAMALFRGALVTLVIAALVGIRVWRQIPETRVCTLALVDVSESMPRDETLGAAKAIAEMSRAASDDRQFGLVVFAGRARVAIAPTSAVIDEASVRAQIQNALDASAGSKDYEELERNATNFEAALDVAASAFPAGMAKRIVLWSDGNETDGAGLALAGRLKNAGIEIHARSVEAAQRPLDVLVASVNAPTETRVQEAFDATVVVMSTRDAAGKLSLYRNGFLTGSKELKFAQGSSEIVFRQSIPESGQYVYRAVFETNENQRRDNDEAFAYLTAVGPPHILVIGAHALESSRLIEALRSRKAFVEYRDAFGSPQSLLELFGYDAVVLNNLPADKLSENQMRVLRDYVRDFGGGAVMIGGQHSLAAGGYAGKPLEEILPVTCSTDGLTPPSVSVALVVDLSRSMLTQKKANGESFDAPAFVRATAEAIGERLSPNDFFGIVGTGNERTAPRWMVRLQKMYDRELIREDIEREFASSAAFDKRSNVYQSMRRAAEELAQQDTQRKQMVVISDGYFDSGYDYPALAAKLNSDHFQISTIPCGPDMDLKVLEAMARWGGGVCVRRGDAAAPVSEIKNLFGAGATEALAEEPFRPRKTSESLLIEGLDINTAPVLFGYVRTKLKAGAANILAVPPEYEPLLSFWNCGEGRCAVFTSDVKDKWGVLWAREWGRNFDAFWNGVVLGVSRRSQDIKLVPHLSVSGQTIRASVDLLDSKERFVSGKKVNCELYYLGEQGLLYSRSNMERFELAADGPGRYSGAHRIRSKGLYAVKFRGPERGQVAATGLAMSNFKEQLTLTADKKVLAELSNAGGGALDAADSLTTAPVGKTRETMTDASHWAIFVACILFLGDVASRRWPAIVRALRGRRS